MKVECWPDSDQMSVSIFMKGFSMFDIRYAVIADAIEAGKIDPDALVRDCKEKIAALAMPDNPGANWSVLDKIL